jgi:predicted methyltransferase
LVLGDLYRRVNERNTEVLAKEVFHQRAGYRLQMDAVKEMKRERDEIYKVFNGLICKISSLKMQLKLVGVKEGVTTRAQKRQRTSL